MNEMEKKIGGYKPIKKFVQLLKNSTIIEKISLIN